MLNALCPTYPPQNVTVAVCASVSIRVKPTSKVPTSTACTLGFLPPSFVYMVFSFIYCLDSYTCTHIHTHTHTHTRTHTHTHTHTYTLTHAHTHTELGCYHTCTKDTPSFALNCTYRVFNSPIKMPAISASTTKCSLMQLSCWVRVCP